MNVCFTILAWIIILSVVPVITWGTVADGSLTFVIDVIKEELHGKA